MRQKLYLIGMCVLLSLSGCATKVERVDIDKKIDLSGKWNDYDAMTVAKDMVADSVKSYWHKSFIDKNNRNPVVIVGNIANKTDEHIDSQVITKYLERELLNSGKVVFVASSTEREEIRDEREDQQRGYTSDETIKEIGKEKGADYMMIGSVHAVKDAVKGKYVILYQANFELIDLETNEKVWIGQTQLKKNVKRPQYSL